MNFTQPLLRCDGCGALADPAHIRRRIERLGLATRFRPIHIGVLFLAAAPPARAEDFFYRPEEMPGERSAASRAMFEDLLAVAGVGVAPEESEEHLLGEFQRAGFYLAECTECPFEDSTAGFSSLEIARRISGTLTNRLQFSYKARHILPLGEALEPILSLLGGTGVADFLISFDGAPASIPDPCDSSSRNIFRTALSRSILDALRLAR
ncbi:MAG: hypothetical protein ACRD50_06045 [Candidatus Acidiferrales bacterium]